MDLNVPNEEGDSPIHSIVCHKRKKRADLLLTLLVNGCSRIDVNRPSKLSKDTALHLAVMVCKTNTYDWMICVSYSYMYVCSIRWSYVHHIILKLLLHAVCVSVHRKKKNC